MLWGNCKSARAKKIQADNPAQEQCLDKSSQESVIGVNGDKSRCYSPKSLWLYLGVSNPGPGSKEPYPVTIISKNQHGWHNPVTPIESNYSDLAGTWLGGQDKKLGAEKAGPGSVPVRKPVGTVGRVSRFGRRILYLSNVNICKFCQLVLT